MERRAPRAEGKQRSQCFKMYSGFVSVRYGKMTEAKTTAFERRVYSSQFPREGSTPCHIEPHGVAPGLVRRGKQGESMSTAFYLFTCLV